MNTPLPAAPVFRKMILPAMAALILLAAWIGGLVWHVDSSIRVFERHLLEWGAPPDAPRPWLARRFFVEHDSYYWLAYARDLRATGEWRMRHTDADNAPDGRPMHWSHLPIWGLMGLARLLETTGRSPALALEWAGRLLLPLCGIAFLWGLFMLLARRMGWLVAALATAALATELNVLWDFHALRPDHHGFQLGFATAMSLCLLLGGMGWVRKPEAAPANGLDLLETDRATRWFRGAGMLGGLALWTGAAVFFFSLAAVAVAAMVSLWSQSPDGKKDAPSRAPDLWRTWSRWGAATGLLFYLLEYAPRFPGMRLEVNHPVYAICWLGLGECLRAFSAWQASKQLPAGKDMGLAIAGAFAAALLPLLLVFGPVDWFWPRAEIMLRLHAGNITEFKTLFALVGSKWGIEWLQVAGVGALALPGAAWFCLRRQRHPRLFPVLAGAWVLSVAYHALFLWQARWSPFASTFSILLAAFWLEALRTKSRALPSGTVPAWAPAALAFLLVAQTVYGIQRACRPLVQLRRVERIDGLWLKALLQRNLMVQLHELAPEESLRLALPAEMAPAVYYFGLGQSIGSLYWENVEGLAAATQFMADPLPGHRAKEIASERRITHVLVNEGAADPLFYLSLATRRTSHEEAAATVAGAAAKSGFQVPAWLEPDPARTEAASRVYVLALPPHRNPGPINLPVQVFRAK